MNETHVIRVRYWAAARAAAGRAEEEVVVQSPISLIDLRAELVGRHADQRFARVLAICSVLIGDRPVSSQDPDTVVIASGDAVDFLPPFAGG